MSTSETSPTNLTPELAAMQQLISVVAKLRSPDGGCPWDLAQTPESLIPYIIEEAYEVVDAIRQGDPKAIAEELGDLLLQVVLQAQIARESGQFTLAEIAQGISEKLIRRHPHVFGEVKVNSIEEVHQNWEQIKASEKGETNSESQLLSDKLNRYARTFPPLVAGMKISKKAAAAGFEWDDAAGVWAKLHEELNEFKYAVEHETKEEQKAELGDILFVLINLARWYDLEPEEALQITNEKFIQRLSKVEAFSDRPLSDYSLEELDQLWAKAKAQIAQQKSASQS
jgi:XTP/dITP diphosphohydrolase